MKKFVFLILAMFATLSLAAQVTTSAISGKVTDANGEAVIGAAVAATHTPSGTSYYASTDRNGDFRLHNMRVGGPYTITVSYLGYTDHTTNDVTLKLGETFALDVKMTEQSVSVEAIVVSATANSILNSQKQGTSTNVDERVLKTMPTGSRTINDFVKLTPQANGMSFGGRDSRMNNFTVDGAGFNNNFGLTSDLPGGDSGPISLDALEEISVSIAPYDVRQSRFTGAAINAVTKSGTNQIDGSFYTYQRFKSWSGTTVGGNEVSGAGDTRLQTYGLSIGGPIVKNKLFLFVNAEYSPEKAAGPAWSPSTDGVGKKDEGISRTTVADLERVHQHLLDKYGYEAGEYQNWSSFDNYNYKIMARLDWNINDNNHLMIRYNDVLTSAMNLTNGNSCPSGLTRIRKDRMSEYSIAFSNNFYRMDNSVRSVAAELNSKLSEKVSNQVLFTYNKIRDGRTSPSLMFPHVDIYKATDEGGNAVDMTNGTWTNETEYYNQYQGSPYMSFGYELFSYNNEVINNTWNITDNVTFNLDRHTIVAGASYEHLYVRNSYIREGTSYYRYASVDDFINDAQPIGFGMTYGYNGVDAPGQMLTFAQASAYVQDEWEATKNLKITAGIRFEMPFYLDNDMVTNTKIQELTAQFSEGAWDTGTWPKSNITVNPRIGFNWDVKGDRSLQVRGGTGLFAGVMPFVWFTNQVGGASFVQCPEIAYNYQTCVNNGITTFTPNYKDLLKDTSKFPSQADPSYLANNASIALVDKNFKFPQIWRSNLAVDVKLPGDVIFTGEILYSKDINAVRQINSNLADPNGTMAGIDNRSVWTGNTKKVNNLSSAMLFTNTNKGYSAQLTAQLTKTFSNGLSAMAAYTYSVVKDVTANPGSAAYSAWTSSSAVNSLNEDVLSYSNFSIPHRVVANLSYRIGYTRNLATTVSLFYQGAHNGRISYIYSGDVNGDGIGADLMYIPSDNEIGSLVFAEYKGMTAEQQRAAFQSYVNDNNYLSKHKGEYAERFGGLQKWVNKFDVKVIQDIFTNFGTNNRYTLQFSLDILNVGNLINDKWGCYYTNSWLNYQDVSPLAVVTKGTTDAAPTFRLNADSVEEFNTKSEWTRALSTGNCWSMLFGVRLLF